VARRLAGRTPLRILARDPERVPVSGPDVQVVRGAYADPAALAEALTGVRAAFLVTTHPTEPDDLRFVDAARSAGMRHVVKLSAYAVGDGGADDFITRRQRENESVIRDSGIAWTMLRPRAFMSNTRAWASSIRAEGVVRAPYGSVPNVVIDPEDVAEVAVRALTEPGHEGRVHALTGPEAVAPAEQTAQLAEVLGRPLRFEELTPEQARSALLRRYPAAVADALLQSVRRRADGHGTAVEPTVARVTERAPRSFRMWARKHVAEFR